MQLQALQTVRAIVEHGSFAAAAHAVGCTPSAVSLQVKQVETWLGKPLFDRSTRRALPTALAHEVAAIAREVALRLDALRAPRGAPVGGRLRLGAIATVQTDALPQALRALRDRHPALTVDVHLGDSAALLADLKAGRLDAAVLVRPKGGGSERLAWQNLTQQPLVLLAPASVSNENPRGLIERLGWIRYDTDLTGGRLAAAYVRRIAPRTRPSMELRAIDAIVAMVSAGLGVSVVPLPRAALLDAHRVRALRLPRGAPGRTIALVRRAGDADQRNIDAVASAFERVYSVEGI
jgi:DNA-binding transcriptional LysR family regulator